MSLFLLIFLLGISACGTEGLTEPTTTSQEDSESSLTKVGNGKSKSKESKDSPLDHDNGQGNDDKIKKDKDKDTETVTETVTPETVATETVTTIAETVPTIDQMVSDEIVSDEMVNEPEQPAFDPLVDIYGVRSDCGDWISLGADSVFDIRNVRYCGTVKETYYRYSSSHKTISSLYYFDNATSPVTGSWYAKERVIVRNSDDSLYQASICFNDSVNQYHHSLTDPRCNYFTAGIYSKEFKIRGVVVSETNFWSQATVSKYSDSCGRDAACRLRELMPDVF